MDPSRLKLSIVCQHVSRRQISSEAACFVCRDRMRQLPCQAMFPFPTCQVRRPDDLASERLPCTSRSLWPSQKSLGGRLVAGYGCPGEGSMSLVLLINTTQHHWKGIPIRAAACRRAELPPHCTGLHKTGETSNGNSCQFSWLGLVNIQSM